MFEIAVANYIDAAHFLTGHQGKCSNIHGHTWMIEVTLKGKELDPIGLLIDFNDVKRIIKEVVCTFDHTLINNTEPFEVLNPSSENLAKYCYFQIKEKLTGFDNIAVVKVVVSESRDTRAIYYE